MFFANEQRENVRAENPNITFGQVGKVLGERWKALNDKQRAPYEAKAAADKKRYEDEKAAFQVRPRSKPCRSLPFMVVANEKRRPKMTLLDSSNVWPGFSQSNSLYFSPQLGQTGFHFLCIMG